MCKSVVVIATIDRPWTRQYRTFVGDEGRIGQLWKEERSVLEKGNSNSG